jgi:hypothetical protein
MTQERPARLDSDESHNEENPMTIISKRVFRPLPGKAAIAHERIRRVGDAISRAGGGVRTASVAWGDGAREIHLYGVFADTEAGAKAATAMLSNADFLALRKEAEDDPASHWEGPEVWRTVFGETKPAYPVMLQREYEVDRSNLRNAIALLPEVQATMPETPMLAIVPVISGHMGRLMIGYYASSLIDLGQIIDRALASEAFQSIVTRAAQYAKLTKSRALVNL